MTTGAHQPDGPGLFVPGWHIVYFPGSPAYHGWQAGTEQALPLRFRVSTGPLARHGRTSVTMTCIPGLAGMPQPGIHPAGAPTGFPGSRAAAPADRGWQTASHLHGPLPAQLRGVPTRRRETAGRCSRVALMGPWTGCRIEERSYAIARTPNAGPRRSDPIPTPGAPTPVTRMTAHRFGERKTASAPTPAVFEHPVVGIPIA